LGVSRREEKNVSLSTGGPRPLFGKKIPPAEEKKPPASCQSRGDVQAGNEAEWQKEEKMFLPQGGSLPAPSCSLKGGSPSGRGDRSPPFPKKTKKKKKNNLATRNTIPCQQRLSPFWGEENPLAFSKRGEEGEAHLVVGPRKERGPRQEKKEEEHSGERGGLRGGTGYTSFQLTKEGGLSRNGKKGEEMPP